MFANLAVVVFGALRVLNLLLVKLKLNSRLNSENMFLMMSCNFIKVTRRRLTSWYRWPGPSLMTGKT